ncbi:tRNA guanosine(15) transglycosylase TgtA [archaeon]|nr:tRNA guanosine(15) transglycosylase TgtA [archaeon]
MQIREKDLAARLASFKTPHGKIETPALLPVVNPCFPRELKKFKPQAIMTNAYLTWKNKKEEARDKGIHKLIGFDGPVMTDSGAFQLMQYGGVDITNKEVIEFEKVIGSDIAIPLDIPGIGNKELMKKNLCITIERAKECSELRDDKRLWVGPLQGGTYPNLRKKAAKAISALNFDVFAVGSVVPLMNEYRFAEALDALHACKTVLPLNKPVHFFGAGHPMMFSFAVALGADLFDSAAYSLFAKRGNYLTVSGTLDIKDMEYLPCSCPICQSRKPSELNEHRLAEHNLYVSFEEMKRIREAIHENTLWELLEERSKAHPSLGIAFKNFRKYRKHLESLDMFTKKRFFVTPDARNRPEVYRHENKKITTKKTIDLLPFKRVPIGIAHAYPFGQRVTSKKREEIPKTTDAQKANSLAKYVYGVAFPKADFERGKTGRLRRAYQNGKLLASFRASDGMIIPHAFAKQIHKKSKGARVVIDDEVQEFAREGKTVFAKFVRHCGEEVRAGMDVLVVNSKDELLASGTAVLSAREMIDFCEGPAVRIREKF